MRQTSALRDPHLPRALGAGDALNDHCQPRVAEGEVAGDAGQVVRDNCEVDAVREDSQAAVGEADGVDGERLGAAGQRHAAEGAAHQAP